jgi:hypothetical protein
MLEDKIFDFIFVFSGIAAIASIVIFRWRQPRLIYILFYLFYLSLCCASVWYIYTRNDPPHEGFKGIVDEVIKISTDVEGEAVLMITLTILIILPQTLAYLTSGLIGCGYQPLMITAFSKFVLLNLAKFSVVLSGVSAAQYLFNPNSIPTIAALRAYIYFMYSFQLIAMYHLFDVVVKEYVQQPPPFKARFVKFMRRCFDTTPTNEANSIPNENTQASHSSNVTGNLPTAKALPTVT